MEEEILPKRQKLDDVSDQKSVEELNINSLPDEMICEIFSYLTHNELGRIAPVCRKWKELSRSPVLWKCVAVRFSGHHESRDDVLQKLMNSFLPCTRRLKLEFFKSWPLNFEELASELQRTSPNLEVFIIHNLFFICNLSSFIGICAKFLPNIRILCIVCCIFCNIPTKIKYDDISKIKILNIRFLKSYNTPPISRMPFLKELHLKSYDGNVSSWFKNDPSYLGTLKILNLHASHISSNTLRNILCKARNLTKLYICYVYISDNDFEVNDTRIFSPRVRKICLNRDPNKFYRQLNLHKILPILLSCRSLKTIHTIHRNMWDEEEEEFYRVFAEKYQIKIDGKKHCTHGAYIDYLHK